MVDDQAFKLFRPDLSDLRGGYPENPFEVEGLVDKVVQLEIGGDWVEFGLREHRRRHFARLRLSISDHPAVITLAKYHAIARSRRRFRVERLVTWVASS